MGRFGSDLFDIYAPFWRSHEHRPLRRPVDGDSEIKFLLDLKAFLDQQDQDLASLGPGLMGNQRHPDHLPCQRLRLFW